MSLTPLKGEGAQDSSTPSIKLAARFIDDRIATSTNIVLLVGKKGLVDC